MIKEAAKIIYQVHDEVKDKMFELELSWVTAATGGVHQVGLDYMGLEPLDLEDSHGLETSLYFVN